MIRERQVMQQHCQVAGQEQGKSREVDVHRGSDSMTAIEQQRQPHNSKYYEPKICDSCDTVITDYYIMKVGSCA